MKMLQLLLIPVCGLLCRPADSSPNLVQIIADDLGWNDVGYHNPDIITPNIDNLARTGIELNHSYVQPLCTPSRATFLTGVYPYRLALQHFVIMPGQAVCVPVNTTFFPQVLKQNGYKTHAVGKWHLGFCKWACTPTFRGFDSFYGFYAEEQDYYNKTLGGYYDFRNNTTVDKTASGVYSTYRFASRAEEIIRDHDSETPLYLYLPLQSAHTPLQVPQTYLDMYPNLEDGNRKTFSAMVTAMDDVIGRVVAALKHKGIYNNTLIMFSSDNGGWTPFGGNNYPLRGGKMSVFEGGTRVPAFLHGPLLNRSGVVYDGIIHAVDWFKTLTSALGIEHTDRKQDGVNQWKAITRLGKSKRSEFVYNLDYDPMPGQGSAAIRVGDYKLIEGFPGMYYDNYQVGARDQGFDGFYPSRGFREYFTQSPFNQSSRLLFNLKDDPNELHNLYDELPDVARTLHDKLMGYKTQYVPPNFPADSPLANPENYGGILSPGWC